MAIVVDIIAVMKLPVLTTCKETIKSRGLCERPQRSISHKANTSASIKLLCIFDQLREQYFVDTTICFQFI